VGYTHSERLSALDATFLALEDACHPMHVGAVGVFEPGELVDAGGGLDFERIRQGFSDSLWRAPRFRQKLRSLPLVGPPVWVDDEHFNLAYHLRHTALPLPGDERTLKRLAGRILSQQLDRGKPLWELWFVEGLADRRFALVAKIHHCLVDGISGVDLLAAFVRAGRDGQEGGPRPWLPRPAPATVRLVAQELRRRAAVPWQALEAGRDWLRRPGRALAQAGHALEAVRQTWDVAGHAASRTSLDVPIGPHRRFDWLRFEHEAVREVRRRLGGTVNDAVLAIVSGALREFLLQRGDTVRGIDFRALVPVSTREAAERGALGNQVSLLLVPLPVGERDPRRRHRKVVEATRRAKRSRQDEGGTLLEALSDQVAPGLLPEVARRGLGRHAFNLVVTNVPGPRMRIALMGAHMEAIHPAAPLFPQQSLGIALMSYAGSLDVGLQADWDAVPDLHDLVGHLQAELERLLKAEPPSVGRPRGGEED